MNDATQMGEGRGLAPLVGSKGRGARTKRGRKSHYQGRHKEEEPWIDEGQCGHRAGCGRPGATHSDGPLRRTPASSRAPPACCGSAGPRPSTPSATPTDALPCAARGRTASARLHQPSVGEDCGARKCGGECGVQRNAPPLGGGEVEETRTGSVGKQRKYRARKCEVRNCGSQECGTESGGSGGCGGGFHH